MQDRMKPADFRRIGELTGKKLSPEETIEADRLLEKFIRDREARDLGGTAYRDKDGKVYAPSTERRARRIIRVRDWRLNKNEKLSKQQVCAIKNLQEQLDRHFSGNLQLLVQLVTPSELTLICDYAACNGISNQIAVARQNRGEKKANPVSVKADIKNLVKRIPQIYGLLQGIKTHVSVKKIRFVPDSDKYSVHVTNPSALAKARTHIDPHHKDDVEAIITPQKRGEELDRLLGDDNLQEIINEGKAEDSQEDADRKFDEAKKVESVKRYLLSGTNKKKERQRQQTKTRVCDPLSRDFMFGKDNPHERGEANKRMFGKK